MMTRTERVRALAERLQERPKRAHTPPNKTRRCVICWEGKAPPGKPYCRRCTRENTQALREHKARRDAWKQAYRFVHWRGVVVGFYHNGKADTYRPERVCRPLAQIPKEKLIDLDVYCDGYTREQVKALKRTIRILAPDVFGQ